MKMKQEKRDKLKIIISFILLFSWCLLIFSFSNQTGDNSNISSSRVLDFINKLFSINLYNYEYSMLIIRKLAHMFLYFILYLLSYFFFKSLKSKKVFLFSFIFCLIYAISDEVHQLFIIERSFGLIDILIDMIGSFISFCFIKLSLKIIK